MAEEYTIESAASKEGLSRLIRKMIKNGWKPLGGICIDIHEDDDRFLQAMVRLNDD